MSKLKIMVAHYIIMGGVMTKLSEVCIAHGGADNVKEMDEIFKSRVDDYVKRLREDPNNIDVAKMYVTDNITYVTFSGLNGTHILEYYITLVSD